MIATKQGMSFDRKEPHFLECSCKSSNSSWLN